MDTANAFLTRAGTILLAPFRDQPAVGLLFWSTVSGILMALVFGKTSNQRALRRAADDIRAQLFAVKMFKDDLVVTFQCQVRLLRSTALRLFHSVPPMLAMFVPLLLVVTQLAMRYEYRPLRRAEQAIVSVRIKPDAWRDHRDLRLESGAGYVVETESLRDEHHSMLFWRVRAEAVEPVTLRWQVGDATIEKLLPIAESDAAIEIANPKRASASLWHQLLYPAEPSLATDGPIEAIEIQLTSRSTPILGWDIPWWATFFLLSMITAFVTGKIVGVQF